MKQSHYAIIGSLVAITILVFVLILGRCSITPCETEIEIISSQIPESVYQGEQFQGEFTIKNIGDVTAENCVLTWRVRDQEYSNTFQLAPLEEKKIQVLNKIIRPHDQSENSWWWVSCENTETPKTHNDIEVKTR